MIKVWDNNVEIDGDLKTVSAEISLIIHDLSMIEHIPDDVLIGAFCIGLADKESGNIERYKRIIEGVRREAVSVIENDIKEHGDSELQGDNESDD